MDWLEPGSLGVLMRLRWTWADVKRHKGESALWVSAALAFALWWGLAIPVSPPSWEIDVALGLAFYALGAVILAGVLYYRRSERPKEQAKAVNE